MTTDMQLPLPPYAVQSDTSYAAAVAKRASAPAQRALVYATLIASGPLTDQELAEHTGLSGDSIRPRRGELQREGLVFDTGQRRLTASKRRAVVWAAQVELPF